MDLPRPSHSPSLHRRRKSWGRKIERCCCTGLSYFPLFFVYGLTSWAAYVEVSVSFIASTGILAILKAVVGVGLYALGNVSYTIAVFTDPGSPLDGSLANGMGRGRKRAVAGGAYEGLPTYEDEGEDGVARTGNMTTVTAKADGKARYCKKCQTTKPDRTHHCSTCKRCVLKMDHHCPWLATCVGLHNYKPFLLFLIYISLFCWVCFAVSASWFWTAMFDQARMQESVLVVNVILLAVLGGIIGLVLSGFTGWHIYLAMTGQTTIESLEKTRYLNPIRRSLVRSAEQNRHYVGQNGDTEGGEQEQSLLEHLKETHVNALPGVLRPEEGEASRAVTPNPPQPNGSSPAKSSLQQSYASMEAQRERQRYQSYLDEQDSEKLPNAFDLGWRRNLEHVFGSRPLFWFLPVCNTSGDGWMWDVSPKWTEARAEIQRQREARTREDEAFGRAEEAERRWKDEMMPAQGRGLRWAPGQGFVGQHGLSHDVGAAGVGMQMQPLDRRKGESADGYDTSSDEEQPRQGQGRTNGGAGSNTANWNDVPDDFLGLSSKGNGSRSRSRGRRKGD